MRFLAILLILIFFGCAKDTPPPAPKVPHQKFKDGKKTAAKKENDSAGPAAAASGQKIDSAKRSNPFLTLDEEKTFGSKNREVLTALKLSAIFSSAKGAYAIIDGKVLKVHDRIDGKEVAEINRNNVVLKSASREYTVNLQGQ